MSETRRLAANLVADVVGYSRLARADEVDEQPERDGRSQGPAPFARGLY
jgi:hypothetical protein